VRKLCLLSIASLVLTITATGQQCGNPPGGFHYSERFYRAEAKFYETTVGVKQDVALPIDDLPIKGSMKGDYKVTNWETLTVDQARSYIQQEHTDRGAQIVAECGYRLCTIAQTPGSMNDAAIAVLDEICKDALSPHDQSDSNSITVSPTVSTVVFSSQASQPRAITVFNHFPGTVNVNVSVDQGNTNGNYISLDQSSFALAVGQSKQLTATVTRPQSGLVVNPSIRFSLAADSKITAITKFTLYPEPELLLPNAVIEDGQLWPDAKIVLDIDNPTSPFRAGHPGPYRFPVANTGPQMCNPGGFDTCASATYRATINAPGSTSDRTSATMNMVATVGGKCGRGSSGGGGGTNPTWQTTLSLPGMPDRHLWNLKVSTDIRHYNDSTGACTISVGSNMNAVPIRGRISKTYTLSPGAFNFQISCTGMNPSASCYGHANGINEHYENDHYTVALEAQRVAKSESEPLGAVLKKEAPDSFEFLQSHGRAGSGAKGVDPGGLGMLRTILMPRERSSDQPACSEVFPLPGGYESWTNCHASGASKCGGPEECACDESERLTNFECDQGVYHKCQKDNGCKKN
jgi:hypothetical protein